MSSRIYYADVLRVTATISVVVLHTTAPILYKFSSIDRSWWWIGNVVDSSCRWCIPIFIMLSGMLLLDTSKSESSKLFFQKRFNKVIVPFVVWSILYSFWKTRWNFSYSISGSISDFLTGDIYYHLWFFYPLIGVYILTPILRCYTKNASSRTLTYFVILWLIATPFYNAINQFPSLTVTTPLYFAIIVIAFLGYFFLGFLLNKRGIGHKRRRYIYVAALAGISITILGTYFLTKHADGVFQGYFYNYFSINVIILSTAIFLTAKDTEWSKTLFKNAKASRFLDDFSSASLGIFLVHPLILDILPVLRIESTTIHPAIGIPLVSVLTISISFVLIRLLQRTPIIKRIVP